MQFPKTHLNYFISSDYDRTSEIDDSTLFNNAYYKSSQAQVPNEIQIQIRNTDLCQSQEQSLLATIDSIKYQLDSIDKLDSIIKIFKTLKCETEEKQRIFNNANRHFLFF